MKKSISISVNEEKLSAIEMYLEQKNTTLAAELEKYADQLYGKVVPQNVSTKNEKKHRCCRRKRWCHSRKNQVSVVCISRDYENG